MEKQRRPALLLGFICSITLAAANAFGDFASSFVIGLLWNTASPSVAFSLSGGLFLLGFVLILRSR